MWLEEPWTLTICLELQEDRAEAKVPWSVSLLIILVLILSNTSSLIFLGAGASLFGPGSDFGGSIRVPSLFTGIFGHKPTAGVVSLKGHFPNSNDKNFQTYLVVGPMARYAKDLMPLLHIMTDKNPKLRLEEPFHTKDIKVGFGMTE